MRFLLLIALALLPLSAALKCYNGNVTTLANGQAAPGNKKVELQCPSESKGCAWVYAISFDGRVTTSRDCAPEKMNDFVAKDSCGEGTYPKDPLGNPGTTALAFCGCKGDLCNGKDTRLDGAPLPKAPPAGSPSGRPAIPPRKPTDPPLKCYDGASTKFADGTPVPDKNRKAVVTTCPATTLACAWTYAAASNGVVAANKKCAAQGDCTAGLDACADMVVPHPSGVTGALVMCCCQDDLCNGKDTRLDGGQLPKAPPGGNPSDPSGKPKDGAGGSKSEGSNPASSIPTALLPLAALAAAIAARI